MLVLLLIRFKAATADSVVLGFADVDEEPLVFS
jgi:hypothetical protein